MTVTRLGSMGPGGKLREPLSLAGMRCAGSFVPGMEG